MENIQVALRIRPINQQEIDNNDIEIWTTQGSDVVGISADKYSDLIRTRKIAPGQKTQYLFNRCFDQSTQNNTIYEEIVKRIALSSLQGINGTIFMYGQTGGGKTFTMMGQNREDVFQSLSNNTSKYNKGFYQQNGFNQIKLGYDQVSPKNMISKQLSSDLTRQQSQQINLVQQTKQIQQQNYQYSSKSPQKNRDSSCFQSIKENKENPDYFNQYGAINTTKTHNSQDKSNITSTTCTGAFKNNIFSFSPLNSHDNFNKKKNSTQQTPFQNFNRSSNVNHDQYLQGSQQYGINNNVHEGFNSIQQSLMNTSQYGVLILSLIDIFKEIQNTFLNQIFFMQQSHQIINFCQDALILKFILILFMIFSSNRINYLKLYKSVKIIMQRKIKKILQYQYLFCLNRKNFLSKELLKKLSAQLRRQFNYQNMESIIDIMHQQQ